MRASVLALLSLLACGAARAEGVRLANVDARDVSVAASVGGGPPLALQVDTGSVGLILWRGALGSDAVPVGPGIREYNSSGRIFVGTYYRTRIAFRTASGAVRTVPLRVLAVDAMRCDAAKPDCRPDDPARLARVAVMGVGFDRDPTAPGDLLGQADNPLLALPEMRAGRLPAAYEIDRAGVTLGASADGFRTLALARRADAGPVADWSRPTGCYALRRGEARFGLCAKLLVDTGLPETILTVPPPDRPPAFACDPRCPPGIAVTVAAGDALAWRYVTGAAGAPAYVRWGRNGATTQINTGRALLGAYDYLFDATRGLIGFRPVR